MALGMSRGAAASPLHSSHQGQGGDVRTWVAGAGLERVLGNLEALASTRIDLAHLTDADWHRVLTPLDLKLGKRRRVQNAIRSLRAEHATDWDDNEQAEVLALQSLFDAGAQAPRHREQGYSTPAQGRTAHFANSHSSPTFVPSASFVGPQPGWVFKAGPQGSGYYLDRGSGATPTRQPSLISRYHAEHELAVQQQQQQQQQQHQQQQRNHASAFASGGLAVLNSGAC